MVREGGVLKTETLTTSLCLETGDPTRYNFRAPGPATSSNIHAKELVMRKGNLLQWKGGG